MATTTNYSWTTPDDTALVKDGAAAIRSLGSSIDTTTKALNPSTTLGDIEYRSSTANTNTRLGIGTSGQVLTVSGGVPSWETASSGGMTLLSSNNMAGVSTITVNSISGSYKHLYFEMIDALKSANNVYLKFNNDTASNYYRYSDIQDYAVNTGATGTAGGEMHIAQPQDAAGAMQSWGYLFNYATTQKPKRYDIRGVSTDASDLPAAAYNNVGYYASSTAVTRIDVTTSSNFTSGTFNVYGVK